MRKPRWILAGLLVGVLAVGIMGSAVLAHSNGDDGGSPIRGFASRVADILGLDEVDVQDAIKQARTETQNDILQHRLDYKVEQGLITQEQADEYLEWYQSRPEGVSPRPFHRFGGFGFNRGLMRGWHHDSAPPTETESSNAILS